VAGATAAPAAQQVGHLVADEETSGRPEAIFIEGESVSGYAGGDDMDIWAAWPGRAGNGKKVGPAHPHERDPALTPEERRRFAEITRGFHADEIPVPPAPAGLPPRLAGVGLALVGATGVLAGLARGDAVVLTVVGVVPVVAAAGVLVWARRRGPVAATGTKLERLWRWLTA